MSLFDHLLPPRPDDRSEMRVLPAQPDGGQLGSVFVGSDFGWLTFSGGRPRAGDIVTILNTATGRHVLIANDPQPFREPIHAGECLCKCPGSDGLAFYAAFVDLTTQVIAIDTAGLFRQVFGQRELGYGVGLIFGQFVSIAVDPSAPHDVWVLDDRRSFGTRQTDDSPHVRRGYFTLCRFSIVAGLYTFQSGKSLTDPYQPVGNALLNPGSEPDPPAIPTNCVSVVEGVPYVSMLKAPARYLKLAGGVLTSHTLTQAGNPYPMGLRGNIVTVPDKPAAKTNRYAIASDGTNYNVIQFTTADVVTRVIPLALDRPVQLATVCNRLTVLSTTQDSFTLLPEI